MTVPGTPGPDPTAGSREPDPRTAVGTPGPAQEDPPSAGLTDARTGADGKTFERPHPLTPLIRGWVVLVAILLGASRELIPDGGDDSLVSNLSGSLRWVLLALVAVVLVAALAGFMTWRFTRFVIDDDELRIETGAVFRQSKRIPFQRLQTIDVVQPLSARIFGLAEMRLEAGAGDSGARLRYLRRDKAARLRDYLLTRASGEQRSITDEAAPTSAWTDLSSTDEVLVRLTPQQLVLGFVLSGDFLFPAVLLAVGLTVTTVLGVTLFALPAVIPLGIQLFSALSKYLIGQFNYTLARSGRGLRISRGLTNLTSQSVPVDRIQGISISQSVTWRPAGLYRVRIDVLGQTRSTDEGGQQNSDSLLFPVATLEQVRTGLRAILPDVDLDAVELHPSPRSARWLRWWNWWTLRHGWDDRVVVTRRGWLVDTMSVVPHAKTQSVRITRGPLQRRLDLATVHVDTTPGPVTLSIVHVSSDHARAVALSQLQRMQRARAEAPAGSASGPALGDPVPTTDPAAAASEG
ncbi:PH domain-containing protein [Auraticoccus monumenti]|uniref:Putative membrane protein n=1 Tax=Auraticoccus monumenti TaxID=675864 RepID=A0A1G6VI09_9ACTN|nr:PH domain-containing protein [Auraticoccus monumenti]SDD53178.1 putative membrane protein [Auraticoccus monumenti]